MGYSTYIILEYEYLRDPETVVDVEFHPCA